MDITIVRDRSGLTGADWTVEELTSLFDPSKFPKSGDSMEILEPETPSNPPDDPIIPEDKPVDEGTYTPSVDSEEMQSLPTEVIPEEDDLLPPPQPDGVQESVLPPVNDGNS